LLMLLCLLAVKYKRFNVNSSIVVEPVQPIDP
jgi:hypothetical protein